jgi:hypothetical protein
MIPQDAHEIYRTGDRLHFLNTVSGQAGGRHRLPVTGKDGTAAVQ